MINYAVIGRRIKERRKRNHMTQAELAEAAGLSVTYISCIERSKKRVSLEALVAISNELGVTADDLLSGNQPHDPAPLQSDWDELLSDCTHYEGAVLYGIAHAAKQSLRQSAWMDR